MMPKGLPIWPTYEYTMTEADYIIIVDALKKTGSEADAAMATKPNAAKKFSADLPAEKLIPYLLESKYYTADVKSSVKVTYVFDADRYSVVSGLTSIRIVT